MTVRTIPEFPKTDIEILGDCLLITQTVEGNEYSVSIPIIFADEFVRQLLSTIEDGKKQAASDAGILYDQSVSRDCIPPMSNKNGI